MKFDRLECVVLAHDIPEHGLLAGDLGAVVEVYPEGSVEVEFVRGYGATLALLTLSERDIRKIDSHDVLATRLIDSFAKTPLSPGRRFERYPLGKASSAPTRGFYGRILIELT